MSIPDLPPEPLKWENQPSTATPFDAEVLNPWGEQIHALAGAARGYAEEAREAAQDAQAPTDQVMANTIATEGTLTRTELDALYHVPDDPEADPGHDVIVLIGQSNMVGRGTGIDPVAFDPSVGRVYTFGATGAHANRIVHAADPLAHWDARPNTVGPGMEFARQYATTLPPHRTVLLVPAAQGATSFSGGVKRWRTTHTPAHENLYLLALRQIRLALEAAGPGARLAGFLWHQGEGDSSNPDYAHDLDSLINALRSALDAPEAWFLVGQMSPPGNALNTGKQATNLVQIDTPRRNYGAAFAYAPWLHIPDDTTHFSAAGARVLGRSYANALPLAVANTPDSEPLPPSNVRGVANAPAGKLVATWDRPVSRFTDFTVQYRAPGASTWQEWAHAPSLHNEADLSDVTSGAQEVRVATVNENGTSTFTEPVTITPPQYLDQAAGTAPWRAHALRRVVTGYTGDLIRVRRSTDDTQQYIGQTPDGQLDEDALRAFVGSGHGYVDAWVNQVSGAGGLQQASTSALPTIVRGGTVLKENGRPVVEFDGIDDHMWSSHTGLYAAGGTVSMAVRMTELNNTANPRLLSEGNTGSDRVMWAAFHVENSDIQLGVRNDSNTSATITSPAHFLPDDFGALAIVDTGSTGTFHSGQRVSDPAAGLPSRGGSTGRFTIGALGRTAFTDHAPMRLSEVIIWTTVLPDEALDAVTANVRAWHHTDQ